MAKAAGQHLIKLLLKFLKDLLVNFVYLIVKFFFTVDILLFLSLALRSRISFSSSATDSMISFFSAAVRSRRASFDREV